MDVHALEYLLLIAETGSLSEAAEKAHLSQPAMTQCLAKLEREAGWPLFNRVNRKLVPTRAGQIYLKGAREMVQIKEETYQSIEQLRRQQGHAVNDQIQVFLQGHNGKWMLFVNRCHVGALQYMEKLQLDTLDILCSQIAYSLQHLFTVFAWKSQNDMDNGLQIPCPEP